jgi:hypothetical protein
MMAILTPCPVSTRQLTWLPDTRQYVGEASSTHGFGRVYDDACDVGLTLVSATSGRRVVFVIHDVETDADGDVRSWTLIPADRSVDATVLLFND